jgi:hypothetical protein
MEDTTMRNRYPDRETLPADLKKDFEVVLREEYREIHGQRQRQYVAGEGSYKFVVDEMASRHSNMLVEDGARVVIQPLSTPNGHIVFCKVQHVLADKNGDHPLIGMVRPNIERGCQIVVTAWRPTKTLLIGRLKELEVEIKRETYTLSGRTSLSISTTLIVKTDDRTIRVDHVGERWIYGSGAKTTCAGAVGQASVQLSLHRS